MFLRPLRLRFPLHKPHLTSRFSTITRAANMGEPASGPESSEATYAPRYIDIGINLTDPIFTGRYRGNQHHPDDLDAVIDRAHQVGCSKLLVTGSDFKSSHSALKQAQQYPGVVFATVGIHPCSSWMFGPRRSTRRDEHTAPCGPDPDAPPPEDVAPDLTISAQILKDLTAIVDEARSSGQGHLVAMGEFGLDYDRLHFCNKTLQLYSFEAQLKIAASLQPQLPLFLHSRAAHTDFVSLLKATFGEKLEKLEKGGVVHSFTGTAEEMRELMELGLHIGINGCSFKTEENCAVVRELHLDRIMIETDGPWCEIRPSHEGWKYLIEKKSETVENPEGESPAPAPALAPASAANGNPPRQKSKKNQARAPEVPERFKSVKKEKWVEGAMVKGRNEPCNIERVAKVVAGIKGVSVEEVCEAAWRNSIKVFGLGEEN